MPPFELQRHAAKFSDPSVSVEDKLKIVYEVRESVEVVFGGEYNVFLAAFFKPFAAVLRTVPPQFTDTSDNKLRFTVLEILSRLPQNEHIKAYVPELFEVCMAALHSDNQDNAVLAVKVVFDLHKTYRSQIEAQAAPFLDFVTKIYMAFPATVTEMLTPAALDGSIAVQGWAIPSQKSFKVLAECPLIVMFLSQVYPRFLPPHLPQLLPLLVAAVSTPGPEPPQPTPAAGGSSAARAAAAAKEPANQLYTEFRMGQVKTMSFLMYLLRQSPAVMEPHVPTMAGSLLHLLRTCPEAATARKELLVATRHMLNTSFRSAFQSRLDDILDERIYLGSNRGCIETQRPLAYTIMAEMVHHLRRSLSPAQLTRAVYMFSGNSYHPGLPVGMHTTCLRLLLQLVDCIYPLARNADVELAVKVQARPLLTRILECVVAKVKHLHLQAPTLLAEVAAEKAEYERQRSAVTSGAGHAPGEDKSVMITALQSPGEKEKEAHEWRALMLSVISGVKTLVFSINNYNRLSTSQQAQGAVAALVPGGASPIPGLPLGATEDEIRMIAR